jgi:hypothetical protein
MYVYWRISLLFQISQYFVDFQEHLCELRTTGRHSKAVLYNFLQLVALTWRTLELVE